MTSRLTWLTLLAWIISGVAPQITQPADWPGIGNLRSCVEETLQGCSPYYVPGGCGGYCSGCAGYCIYCVVDCTSWECACNNFQAAMDAVISSASAVCTLPGSSTDISDATSIWNAFCIQLLATPTGPTTPTQGATTERI
jgi:hypothetical protein